MESDIIALLLKHIADRKTFIEQGLAIGGAQNFEEYCKMVGGYSILRELEEEVKHIEQRYLEA